MCDRRVARILTSDLPKYFAIVTRVRQQLNVVGADGLVISSTVASQVQAVFPPGALTKSIPVGLQVGSRSFTDSLESLQWSKLLHHSLCDMHACLL